MEFREVMKEWARMCYSFRCSPNGCSGCPLVDERCYHEMPCRMDISIIEIKVMSWAAEHPEPVYPRWIDWLVDVGLIINTADHYEFNFTAQIPADIAQKLGLEPKEV